MRSPRNPFFATLALMALAGTSLVWAAPPTVPAPTPSAPAPLSSVPSAIPDYGGRDSAPLAGGDAAPSPAAQAGRALEALVLVLAGIGGVVYALKRFGLVQAGTDGKPARISLSSLGRSQPFAASLGDSDVAVEASQVLPGGAMLHVVRVPGRTVLLAATAHTVTAVAEWPMEAAHPQSAEEAAAFEEYLARAETPESGIAAANLRLRSLLTRPQPPKDTL